MYSLSSELSRSRVQIYTDEFIAFLILSHSSAWSGSGSKALERYIDFYERVEAVKLLHQNDVRSLILIKIEPRNQKLILDQSSL